MEDWENRIYGLATLEQVKGLDGLTILQKMIDGDIPPPSICRQLTFSLVEVSKGFAAFEGDTGHHLHNPFGGVHGGWALTLIDSAAGCAAHSLLPPDTGYVTIETKGNFSKPIRPDTGRVRCEAKVVSAGRRIISSEAWVKDSQGTILAHGTSTLMVLSKP